MAENKKVIISIVVDDKSAKKNLNEVEKSTKKAGDAAEKANKGFLGLGKTFGAIARGFVIVKSFQLLARAITSTIQVAAEFELTMAKVRATTQASDEEFKKLEKSARDLALGTIFTATQIGELQLAYSKLGFTTQEILNATEATLDLATATGEDLASSADVVGSVIRGFNLDASETTRVVDVMARSFTSSALNLESFKQSMKTVAPIANAANVDLETTTALLGRLADSGLRGTRAATGLKNLISQLSSPTSKLAQELGYTVNSSEALIHAFTDLSQRNIDLAKATGLTDERSKAAFLTIINGVSSVQSLTTELEASTGAASRMAAIVGDTLTGSWKTFQSQIEETQIAITNSDVFKSITNDLSALLVLFREGGDAADMFKSKLDALPFIEKDFEAVIKAEKKFFEERRVANELFAKENQKILDETTDRELAVIQVRERTIEKRKQDEEEYLAFLKNQRKLLLPAVKDAQTYLELAERKGFVDLIAVERLKKLQDANNSLSKEIKAIETSTANVTKEIEGLNKILPKSTDAVYDWAAAWADANKEINGMFSSGDDVFTGIEKLFDPTKMSTSADGIKLLEEQLQSLTDAFADGEVQTQDTFFARLFGVSDQEFQAVKDQLVDGSQELMNIGFDMLQVQLENRLNALQIANQREYDDFINLQDDKAKRFDIDMQHQLDSFTGTEQQKADFEKQKALEQLEFQQQQEAERNKLRQKQLAEENKVAKASFRANKINSLANIAIDTAKAVAGINANPIVNADITQALRTTLTQLVTGIGIAQGAVVASQRFQPKTFQDGGVIQGESHANGGVPFTVAGQAGFEAEGGEYIFSRKTVNRLGVDFLDSLNFGSSRQAPSMMFANGGSVPMTAQQGLNQAELADMIGEAVAMRISEIPVVNVATETAQISRGILNAEAMATL